MQVSFSSEARSDFRAAIDWYDGESPGLGDAFAAEVERVARLLIEFPDIGAPAAAGTRRVHLRRFHHSLVYQSSSTQIWVVAVEHHRRRPEFWKSRL